MLKSAILIVHGTKNMLWVFCTTKTVGIEAWPGVGGVSAYGLFILENVPPGKNRQKKACV